MDVANCELAAQLVSKTYIDQGGQALVRRRKLIKSLLSQRRVPEEGWDEDTIQLFLSDLALMDSNNFVDNVGLGEREGRVACGLVRRRNYGFSHGIGRSGELSAEQPKAAGSSLAAKLTNHLVRDVCGLSGFEDVGTALTVPVSTGMALVLSLMAVRSERPRAKYVLWSRIDQKTCIKCIPAAGYLPIVIPLRLVDDHLETDVSLIDSEIQRIGADDIACVLSTTSCFAPRAPDDVVSISKLCKKHGIPHIINNAYGVQSRKICERITSAWRKGRVDVVVQSTDKNFMVPVGGSILLSSNSNSALHSDMVKKIDALYPGRASMGPSLDLLTTLLHLGREGWTRALQDRNMVKKHLIDTLHRIADEMGEKALIVDGNDISYAITLNSLGKNASFLGSMLFQRCASGARILVPGATKNIAGLVFDNFGTSHDEYPHQYMTVAAAIGTSMQEIDSFFERFRSCVAKFKANQAATLEITKSSI